MKELRLNNLTKNEMNEIVGGDSGSGGAVTCTCDCGGGDTTYQQAYGNISSADISVKNNPPVDPEL